LNSSELGRQLNGIMWLSRWILVGVIGALAILGTMLVAWSHPPEMRFLVGLGQAASWLRDAVPVVVTWPVIVAGVILYWGCRVVLGMSRVAAARLASIFGRFRSLKLLGAEVAFSEEGARRLASDAEHVFDEFRRQADLEFQRQARRQDLRRELELIFQSSAPDVGDDDNLRTCARKPGFRCAIHVPDILFTDTLYQLLDYYPKQERGGAGRRFSTRFGIIGRAWRLNEHQGEEAAAHSKEALIREWGMTDEEAESHSRQRPAYVCAVLHDQRGLPLGVLFVDSTEHAAFGGRDQAAALAGSLALKAARVGFTEALQKVLNELSKYSTAIQIHG
jgi:hypothetical protein